MKKPWLEWAQRSEQLGTAPLSESERQLINGLLRQAGFDGNGRFDSIGQAINRLSGILESRRVEVADDFAADIFKFTSPPHNFDLAFSNPEDPFSPIPITNSMLSVSWYQTETGMWEILAYLT